MLPTASHAEPSRGVRLAWNTAIAVAALLIVTFGMRLVIVTPAAPFLAVNCDLRVPLQYEMDGLLILPFVKETVEHHCHWRAERLGAPGTQQLYDFPVIDHWHFLLIWLMGRVLSNPVVVFNLYYLFTYPAAAVTQMAVLRSWGLSFPAAAAGGIIYAFLPYHMLRGESHYFLAAYYVVPLTTLVIMSVIHGTLPFFRTTETGSWRWHWRNRETAATILISILTAFSGAYYAFFACLLFVPAAILGTIQRRTGRAAVSAGLCVALITAFGVVQHLPTFVYKIRNGPNVAPTERYPEESEVHALKVTHLVLPISGHNLRSFAWLKGEYGSGDRPSFTPYENDTVSLGIVGTVGLLVLCGVALFGKRSGFLGSLAVLTVFILVFSGVGGFGSLFNQLISPQIRCYNRIVVYLAVFTTFTTCLLMDRWFDRRNAVIGLYRPLAFAMLVVMAIWDQSGDTWFRVNPYRPHGPTVARQAWANDRDFFSRVESILPQGNVFTYPYVPFPEAFWVFDQESYSHVRGYLHTKDLRWSFGAMKGREDDHWIRNVSAEPPEALLRRIVARGFDGLFVDTRMIAKERRDATIDSFRRVLGSTADPSSAPLVHADGEQFFFDLRSYRAWLIAQLGPEAYARAARAEAEQVAVLWAKGFAVAETHGREDKFRRCGPKATLVFVNPSDRTRRFRVSVRLATDMDRPSAVRILGGDIWTDEISITSESGRYLREIAIPPGRHQIFFRNSPPRGFTPADHRDLFVNLFDFLMEPLD